MTWNAIFIITYGILCTSFGALINNTIRTHWPKD